MEVAVLVLLVEAEDQQVLVPMGVEETEFLWPLLPHSYPHRFERSRSSFGQSQLEAEQKRLRLTVRTKLF
jgi:hypothetical protein